MKCIYCGKEIAEKSKFCKYCGGSISGEQYIESNKCSVCGAKLPPGVKFCVKCGASVLPNENGPHYKKKLNLKIILSVMIILVMLWGITITLLWRQGILFNEEPVAEQKKTEVVTGDAKDDEKQLNEENLDDEADQENNIEVAEETKTDDLVDEDSYIIPESNQRYLTEEDLKGLTAQELNYAKNEIYARHGRLFLSNELQAYFSSKTWYSGIYSADSFDSQNLLSNMEKKNAEIIRDMEYRLEPNGYALDK